MTERIDNHTSDKRTLGLWGATGVGVGAIVGGGILALAGVAFATTGPGATLAFGLNGFIAFLTALSFSELAARFPESGGTYTYARKVLNVQAAFGVGWVVWFASVVAAVLYALGFATFLVPVLESLSRALGSAPPEWLSGRPFILALSLGAVVFYSWMLSRTAAGGGPWATIGKVVVFCLLLAGGAYVMAVRPPSSAELTASFTPFLSGGWKGLIQAMGYSFIALQGFDLIAAVGGEVRSPQRNIPRSMLLSLGIALVIYIPLLLLIVAIGSPGQPIANAAGDNPEIFVALAAESFLGPTGYWLILIAGVLSMLSALEANLFAASRFAQTMARDRTLSPRFGGISASHGTPVPAILLTGVVVTMVLLALPDVAAAGAMSSLIFLASFALAHLVVWLVRARVGESETFRTPAFPLIPLVGGTACIGLAVFQALAVPEAGVLAAAWLLIGAVLFITRFKLRASAVDAAEEARNPQLVKLRGRKPLVLAPIANPASTETLVGVANAIAPRAVASVLLLSVVRPPKEWVSGEQPRELKDAQSILGGALSTAFAANLAPQALVSVGDDPWSEIARVARRYQCESMLLGFGHLGESLLTGPLEQLINGVDSDFVILRAPSNWDISAATKILAPVGGRRDQSSIRARLVGHLCREGEIEVTYLRVMPPDTPVAAQTRARRSLQQLAEDEAPGENRAEVALSGDVIDEVVKRATDCDLIVLGLQRLDKRQKPFGGMVLEIASRTECPLMMISQRD